MTKDVSNTQKLVGIVMGSDSDLPVMKAAAETLENFMVPYEIRVISAHRSPLKASSYASSAASRGLKAIIAGAGWAAHLAGVLAAETTIPVIGVPLSSSPLSGMDSLLATVQMPAGIPVATMSLDAAGAKNAAILAIQILALTDNLLLEKLKAHKDNLAKSVENKDIQIKNMYRGQL